MFLSDAELLRVEFAQSKTSMRIMSNLVLYLVIFLSYGTLAVLFWRAQLAGNAEVMNRGWMGHAVAIPLALHAALISQNTFVGGTLNLSLVYAISMILWLTVLVYSIARFFYPVASLQTLVLPLVAIGAVLPGLFPEINKLSEPTSLAFDAHVLAAMMAYSLFTIAVLHAVLMSLVEKRLHHASMPRVLRSLPPLMTMETLLFRIIGVGFILLTLTLASGVVFSEQIFGRAFQFNHKVVFGIVSWLLFGVLLLGHTYRGWRGRTAVRWTVTGFVFLVLAYLGTQFVLEVILHR